MMSSQIRTRTRGFHFRIVIPVVLTIAAFVLSFNLIFIPSFQKNLIDKKKEMIRELTHTAWSILDKLHEEQLTGSYTEAGAQHEALSILQKTRYGDENKDYFWVTDLEPRMLIHPYRPDLNGSALNGYADPNGKKLFVEAVRLVKEQQEGFLDYFWQWKDDSTRVVPKLSFVKSFEPWGWVIGTGIYLEDVRNEIATVKTRLTITSLIITLFAALLLLYLLRQSFRVESQRQQTEEDLKVSREKYRSLVEASTEASFMVIDGKLVFYNPPLADLLGYEGDELYQYAMEDLFSLEDDELTGLRRLERFKEGDSASDQFEIILRNNRGEDVELVVNLSRITLNNRAGFIGILKSVTRELRIEKHIDHLADDLQATLLLMNQPVTHLMKPPLFCRADLPVREVAAMMSANQQPVALVSGESQQLLGLVTDRDLRERVLATSLNAATPVYQVMTAPVVSVGESTLLFEAQLLMQEKKVAHLVVLNRQNKASGVLSQLDLARLSALSNSLILNEIDRSDTLADLKDKTEKLSAMVRVMIETGATVKYVSRLISTVADRITVKIIELGLQLMGDPPVRFAFMALGSEGREEQSLFTDQDNCLVYDDGAADPVHVSVWFGQLADYINTSLDQVGYRFCEGKVMAMNPAWCQPLTVWKQYFRDWINKAEPQNLLDVSIFFDFKLVWGDVWLYDQLNETVIHTVRNKQVFFYHLAQQVLQFKPPTDVFGNLHYTGVQDRAGKFIDLKKCLMPVVTFARVYAWRNEIQARGTGLRLQHLVDAGLMTTELWEKSIQAFHFLTRLRLQHQVRCQLRRLPPDNLLEEGELSEIDLAMFKKVLTYVAELQLRVKADFPG